MQPQGSKALQAALKKAKETGSLNLQNLGLDSISPDIVNFAEFNIEGVTWWSHCSCQSPFCAAAFWFRGDCCSTRLAFGSSNPSFWLTPVGASPARFASRPF